MTGLGTAGTPVGGVVAQVIGDVLQRWAGVFQQVLLAESPEFVSHARLPGVLPRSTQPQRPTEPHPSELGGTAPPPLFSVACPAGVSAMGACSHYLP
jgi:hypothetical protein